ncbi:MAG: PEP-CTERM sorting domain-containing protein [Armatimonadetes bacterium]|nr:PEP-CTERM sorting domain-containing protein [Armatimonadota bacterium]
MKASFSLLVLAATAVCANAAPVVTTTQGNDGDLAKSPSAIDLIEGKIATELPGDKGWHPANSDPLDKLPAFTDGQGMRATGLTGLLNDFPGPGTPTKLIQYDLNSPTDIWEIDVFSGNNGRDGRVFHTYTVAFSTDGANYSNPIYVQSHPSGTLNNANNNQWARVLTQLTDSAGPLATGVTNLRFSFYAVDNTQGQMRDPFDGVNPFTGIDDGLGAPISSPLILEIDVVPEPASVAAMALGLTGFAATFRRRRA